MATSLADVATTAPWAFGAGCVLGFIVGARYRISRRNGHDE